MAVFLYWFIRPFCKHFSEIVSVYLFLVDSKLIKSKFTSNLKTFFFALRWLWKMYMLPQKQQVLMVAQSLLIERSSFWVAKNKWNFWHALSTLFGRSKKLLDLCPFQRNKNNKTEIFVGLISVAARERNLLLFLFCEEQNFWPKKKQEKKITWIFDIDGVKVAHSLGR